MQKKECSLRNVIPIERCTSLIDWKKEFNNDFSIDVEIGFGTGEHLINLAQNNSGRNFIGIEQDRKRLLKTARKITLFEEKEQKTLDNVRMLGVDAWIVFERLFLEKNIDSIHCLFPCPWPKKKHIKFRLFNNNFLKLLNSRLKIEGTLKIVTDFYPFFEWILEQLDGTGFVIVTDVIGAKFNTKFEKKWKEQGQEEFFEIVLNKIDHIPCEVMKEIRLKAYKIKLFNPDKFIFHNIEGEISIILKDMIYDNKKQHALVRFVVSEQNLIQHFWVSIAKKAGEWNIYKAVGQNLLQTQGLSYALHLVAEAVEKSAA